MRGDGGAPGRRRQHLRRLRDRRTSSSRRPRRRRQGRSRRRPHRSRGLRQGGARQLYGGEGNDTMYASQRRFPFRGDVRINSELVNCGPGVDVACSTGAWTGCLPTARGRSTASPTWTCRTAPPEKARKRGCSAPPSSEDRRGDRMDRRAEVCFGLPLPLFTHFRRLMILGRSAVFDARRAVRWHHLLVSKA